jgi:hypothetical protein
MIIAARGRGKISTEVAAESRRTTSMHGTAALGKLRRASSGRRTEIRTALRAAIVVATLVRG